MGDFKAPTAKPVTLVGCCHCKANKYTIRLQEMKTVHYCTCSVCTAHSFLWLFPDPSAVTIESSGPLSSYEWNTKKFRFEVCYYGVRALEGGIDRELVLLIVWMPYPVYHQRVWRCWSQCTFKMSLHCSNSDAHAGTPSPGCESLGPGPSEVGIECIVKPCSTFTERITEQTVQLSNPATSSLHIRDHPLRRTLQKKTSSRPTMVVAIAVQSPWRCKASLCRNK